MNNNTPEKSLISGETLLILSFFLVGMVVGRMVEAGQHMYALTTGLSGLALYYGLEKWGQHRQNCADAKHEEAMMETLKGRIDKLVTRESLIPYSRLFPKKSKDCTEQYVTVTHSQKRPKSATRFAEQHLRQQQQQTVKH